MRQEKTKSNTWGAAPFIICDVTGATRTHRFGGRLRWALETLIAVGERGATPINTPGPRWSAYILKLRQHGLAIESIRENHGGPFAGQHVRYVLRTSVKRGAVQ